MSDISTYVPNHVAKESLGVNDQTLRGWCERGWIDTIRTPAGQRLYNVKKFVETNRVSNQSVEDFIDKKKFVYCRVSSAGQKDDLERQVSFMQDRLPNHTVVTDIGSGLNFKRKGLQAILEQLFKGLVAEVVIAHKDRLCRFGFDLLEWIFKQHHCKLVVLDQRNPSIEQELAEDLISIVHVFSCRINGKRKYTKKPKQIGETEKTNQNSDDKTLSGEGRSEDNPDVV